MSFRRGQTNAMAAHGDHLVGCAMCPVQGLRSHMVWMVVQAPGYPRRRMLVHPECWDPPHPRALEPKFSPVIPPDHVQVVNTVYSGQTAAEDVVTPTLSSISPSSTTVAALASSRTVTLTGTGFHQSCVGRFNGITKPTSYTSATSLTMTINTSDVAAGTHSVDVWSFVPPSSGNRYSNTLTLTVT